MDKNTLDNYVIVSKILFSLFGGLLLSYLTILDWDIFLIFFCFLLVLINKIEVEIDNT